MSELSIGLILPDVLGTYGDDGNALVLRERARRRGIDADIVPIKLGDAVPRSLDIYTVGGGEDVAQTIAAEHLIADGGIKAAAEAGKQILAICAGFQIFGTSFRAGGKEVAGLGVVDAVTESLPQRAIGEIATAPTSEFLQQPLTGFENHMGRTTLGADARELGTVIRGVGNAGPVISQENSGIAPGVDLSQLPARGGAEGAVQGSVVCTYLHGPVLARNPELADLLLARAIGVAPGELIPLEVAYVEQLRRERLFSKPRPKSER